VEAAKSVWYGCKVDPSRLREFASVCDRFGCQDVIFDGRFFTGVREQRDLTVSFDTGHGRWKVVLGGGPRQPLAVISIWDIRKICKGKQLPVGFSFRWDWPDVAAVECEVGNWERRSVSTYRISSPDLLIVRYGWRIDIDPQRMLDIFKKAYKQGVRSRGKDPFPYCGMRYPCLVAVQDSKWGTYPQGAAGDWIQGETTGGTQFRAGLWLVDADHLYQFSRATRKVETSGIYAKRLPPQAGNWLYVRRGHMWLGLRSVAWTADHQVEWAEQLFDLFPRRRGRSKVRVARVAGGRTS